LILVSNPKNLLIEFDGVQHFKFQEDWHTREKFDILQKHDKLKNEFCKNNNIELLIIRYDEYTKIECILQKYF